MKRRSFLHVAGSVAGASVLGPGLRAAEPDKKSPEGMPRRVLGKTGLEISTVIFPGLALVHAEQEEGAKAMHRALDEGVNYFDVAPAYGNGDAEIKMGIGLQDVPRDRYFLACKTKMRDKEGARQELERSLQRLKTDHFDVYQLHCLRSRDEVKQALGPGGAMETILEAQKEGKVRYIGFSAHTWYAAVDAIEAFDFDTVMFPINFVEMLTWGFGKQVIEAAGKKNMGILAIKAMSRGAWPQGMERTRKWWYRCTETEEEINLAIRYTLSLPGVTTAVSPSFIDLFEKSVAAAKAYRPITDEEVDKLRKIAAESPALFKREHEQFAHADAIDHPVWPDSPHECCGGGEMLA
ncbi:aldo/keto reductase [Thermostilla marina]